MELGFVRAGKFWGGGGEGNRLCVGAGDGLLVFLVEGEAGTECEPLL
jgi:hypothetical protein